MSLSLLRRLLMWFRADLWLMLDDLVGTGIVGINPLEPHSSMDVKDVWAKYENLVLWGGVDNSFMLIHETASQVRSRVEELKEFGKNGGLLIGSTGQIHPACKLENLIAMIETVHGSPIE